jgi:ATP-dependent DNA helicase HFM1/MER3
LSTWYAGSSLLNYGLFINSLVKNAEIGLGTITSLSTAKKWLSGTFLYVRMRENPDHYRLDHDHTGISVEDQLENICSKDIALLREHNLVQGDNKLSSTDFGDAVSRYYVQFDTAKLFLSLPPKAKVSEIVSSHSMLQLFGSD